jgi:transposase
MTPDEKKQTGEQDPNRQDPHTVGQTGEQEPNFAAFVGIDWGDKEHAWSMEIPGSRKRLTGKLKHTPEAIAAWAVELSVRFDGRPVAVALEQARGALVYALSAYGHLVLYPVHPTTSSRYREAIFPSGSKDDPKDADATLDLLVRHRDRLRRYQPDTPQTRKLQVLVQKRRQLVDERTAQTNRITDLLKLYFPQVLDWFDEVGAPLVGAFLERWPTLEQVQKEDGQELQKFFHQHQCRSPQRIQERLEAIREARPLIRDIAVIDPSALVVAALLRVVAALREGIAALDRAIQEGAAAHPDLAIFASFPGAGPVMAPRLLAAFGSLRERFASANEMQSFSGIAPVVSRSGETQRWIHFRWACAKFPRQTFHEFAALSIPQCAWAREFYERQRAKGKGHHAAVRSLAFKWIRILFRCWQSRTPYQEDIYLRAVAQRSAPADRQKVSNPRPRSAADAPSQATTDPRLGFLACGGTVDLQWKKVGGFWKISDARA